MFFYLSFLIGVFAVGFFNQISSLVILFFILLYFILVNRRSLQFSKLISYLLCFVLGIFYFQVYNVNIEKQFSNVDLKNETCRVQILSDITNTEHSIKFEGKILDEPYKTKAEILLYIDMMPDIDYLDIIEISKARISSISDSSFGNSFNLKKYMYSKKIHLKITGNGEHVQVIKSAPPYHLQVLLFNLRKNIDQKLYKYFDDEPYMMLNGILIGDNDIRSDEFDEMLAKTGLAHIVVVSGMHFSILILLLSAVLKKLRIGRKMISLITILFSILLAMFIGFSPSVVRACIMVIILCFADIFEKERKTSVHLLTLTAVIMILFNPNITYNMGFILSFVSILGILLLNDKFYIKGTKIPKFIKTNMAVTLSANVFTIPFSAYSFSNISLIFVLGNLLLTPIMAYIMLYGFIVIICGSINLLFGYYISIPLNTLLKFLIFAIRKLSQIPFGYIHILKISTAWILLYFFIIILTYTLKKSRMKTISVSLFAFLLTLVLFLPLHNIILNKAEFQILNKQDSGRVFIQYNNKATVIDLASSDNSKSIEEIIENETLKKVDYYIISDEIQFNLLYELSQNIEIKSIYYPKYLEDIPYYKDQLEKLSCNKIPIKQDFEIKNSDMHLTLKLNELYNISVVKINFKDTEMNVISDMNYNLINGEQYIVSYNLYKLLKNKDLLKQYQILNDETNTYRGLKL